MGGGDYVTVGTVGDTGSNLQQGTHECWFTPATSISGDSGQQFMIDIGSRAVVGFYPHGGGTNGELIGTYYQGADFLFTGSGITSWSAGIWHHVVYTFDTVNNEQKIYVDGVLKNTTVHSDSIVYVTVRQAGFSAEVSHPEDCFNGTLDEVRIYGAALEASQIKARYVEGLDKLHSKGKLNGKEYYQRLTETEF